MSLARSRGQKLNIIKLLREDSRIDILSAEDEAIEQFNDPKTRFLKHILFDGKDAVIKIPFPKIDNYDHCAASYNLLRAVSDSKNLARLIGSEPYKIGPHWAILSELANISGDELIDMHNDADDSFTITSQVVQDVMMGTSKGLAQVHHSGNAHRDVKISNNLQYDSVWTVADFTTATGKTIEPTASAKINQAYWAQEIFEMAQSGSYHIGSAQDTFAWGQTIISIARGEELPTAHDRHVGSGGSLYDLIQHDIERLDLPHTYKKALFRSSLPVAPKGKSGDEYRAESMEEIVAILTQEDSIEVEQPNPDAKKKIDDLFDESMKKIDAVVSSVQEKQKSKDVMSMYIAAQEECENLLKKVKVGRHWKKHTDYRLEHKIVSAYEKAESLASEAGAEDVFQQTKNSFTEYEQATARHLHSILDKMDVSAVFTDTYWNAFGMIYAHGRDFVDKDRDPDKRKFTVESRLSPESIDEHIERLRES